MHAVRIMMILIYLNPSGYLLPQEFHSAPSESEKAFAPGWYKVTIK